MFTAKCCTFLVLSALYFCNSWEETTTNKGLLSRKKRWLIFPVNSKFIATFTATSLLYQPIAKWQTLLEMDIPFDLPTNTKLYPIPHQKHRRHLNNQLEGVLKTFGYNGTDCMLRVNCEVQDMMHLRGKSLLIDVLIAVIKGPILPNELFIQDDFDDNLCNDPKLIEKCPIDIVDNFLNGKFIL